jgi:cytochrome c biogenesis protein CcdA
VDWATTSWLGLGLGLGLVHALDADHVIVLSLFATERRSRAHAVGAGLRWALGHGCVLLLAGGALLLLGRSLPEALSLFAERVVGIVMIGLGLYVWLDVLRRRIHLHVHVHDDLPPHAHWHAHERGRRESPHAAARPRHRHSHGPVMVGALHGLAGSAPLLAVLPASARSPALGMAYLVVFAVGVALAMSLMSGLVGGVAEGLSRADAGRGRERGLQALRALCASGSIAAGLWLAVFA